MQEATSELVTTLNNNIEECQKKKQLEEKMSTKAKDSCPTDAVGFTSEPFEFEYTFKVSTKVFFVCIVKRMILMTCDLYLYFVIVQ